MARSCWQLGGAAVTEDRATKDDGVPRDEDGVARKEGVPKEDGVPREEDGVPREEGLV